MAARRLETIVVFSRAGGLFLAVAALAVLCAYMYDVPGAYFTFRTMFITTLEGLILIPWDAYVLSIQVRWLCLRGEQPGNVKFLVLIAVEWLVASLTIGMACAALSADLFGHYCATDSGCVFYLVAGGMACTAGPLIALSALGMLWIHGSQFRRPQAPLV
ncbi:unnamed protein product [Alopecurus aequalis]